MQTLIINTDNTNKYTQKERTKENELLHLYFDSILVAGIASV